MFSTRYRGVLAVTTNEWLNSEHAANRVRAYVGRKEGNVMNLKPLGDRVIVKQDEAEETTASGLFLATEAKEKPQSGTVLAVGDGKLDKDGNLVPVPVKVGDKVVYGKFGGTEINVEGEDVLILRGDDLYAVFA